MSVSLIANRIRAILRLATFVLLLLAVSCASGSDAGPDSGADAVLHAPDLDAWLAAVANQSDSGDETPVVYSSMLIEQAYRAGDINLDEYYTLRIAAVYDHANLDARFRAEPEPHPSATSLLRELAHVYDTPDESPRSRKVSLNSTPLRVRVLLTGYNGKGATLRFSSTRRLPMRRRGRLSVDGVAVPNVPSPPGSFLGPSCGRPTEAATDGEPEWLGRAP